jgi:uracil-DNA glycosylase family 4
MFPDGAECATCAHAREGSRFIPSDGTGANGLLLVGDSPWKDEQRAGRVFAGAAGKLLDRVLTLGGMQRNDLTIWNTIQCNPPHLGWMDAPRKYPEAAAAVEHCRPHLDQIIADRAPKVIVPMGNVALRRICGISGIEANAGYVLPTAYGIPAVPTYHPAFLLKGKQNLIPSMLWALARARDIANGTYKASEYELLIDPDVHTLRNYLDSVPDFETLFVDIETPESARLDEEELEEEGPSFQIVRAGFSVRQGTAVSFPWCPPFIEVMHEAIKRAKVVVEWADNRFDTRRLAASGASFEGKRIVSAMWAWHWLQSDLRKGLGLVAPFYYAGPPWKHLSDADPGRYNALDNAIGLDCFRGVQAALRKQSRYEAFERYCVDLVAPLEAMGKAGLLIDTAYRDEFMAAIAVERDVINERVQAQVPEAVKPRKFWKRQPKDLTGVREIGDPNGERNGPAVSNSSDQCREAYQVGIDGLYAVDTASSEYKYERVLAFNPASPAQVQALARHLGIKLPPKDRSSDDDDGSTDEKALKRAGRTKKGRVFNDILEYRKRSKLIDAYTWPVDAGSRVHYSFSFHPSTWRKCVAKGSVIEIVRDLSRHPFGIPIEEVQPGDLAYTYDAQGTLTLRPVLWVKKTGTKKVVRLHWTTLGGHCLGFLDVTPDHLVRLTDGSYKEAQDLKLTHGRRKRTVAGDKIVALHRGDFGNSKKIYSRLTGWGFPNGKDYILDHDFVYQTLHGDDWQVVHHKDGNSLNNLPSNLRGITRSEHLHIEAYKRHRNRRKTQYNHRIVGIEELPEPVDVYDMEVEGTHCFIANELCVHNSCRNVNIQTIPKRSDLAKRFRRMIVAAPGNVLIEGDSSAIEAVLVGWLAGSAKYMRLAKCGVHGWLTSKLHREDIPLSLSDDDLSARCKASKQRWPDDYEKMKRVTHLTGYLGTPRRIHEEYPDDFASEAEARDLQQFLLGSEIGQDIKQWQRRTVERAHHDKFLENHFGLRHRFYSLYQWNSRRQAYEFGDDAKRAVAFVPQSMASFIQSEVVLKLVERGWLPMLRAIVHDSIIMEVPEDELEGAAMDLHAALTAPIKQLNDLTIGAEIKYGPNLHDMTEWQPWVKANSA